MANTAFPMLSSATAATDGTWGSLNNTKKVAIHIAGLGTGNLGTVTIQGSNTTTVPASGTHHVTLLTATTEAFLVLEAPTKWAKVRISEHIATGSASISTYISGGFDG